MKITTNTAAKVAYKIYINDRNGELIEFADNENPRTMIFGHNSLMPGFETNMNGLGGGDSFEFTLNPDESFGIYRDDLLVNVPKSAFYVDGVLKEDLLYIGNEISMLDNNGNVVSGRVIEINAEDVKMDFNHKFAGNGIYVAGTVQSVRMVTEEDLAPKGGCGSGCGCASNSNDSCGTNHSHEKVYEEDCPSCGNPAELRGKGHGNCGCA